MQLVLLTLGILALASAEHVVPLNDHAVTEDNANHVFNTIHSSMRQWGSSWNHNGMSFFMARVPANTELYHGGRSAEPVTGLEWLAFEPEHALNFAAIVGFRGNRTHGRPLPSPPPLQNAEGEILHMGHHVQIPLHEEKDDSSYRQRRCRPPMDCDPGFFHIYRTKHPLSLLYIDGISAGKSTVGTLDSQDYVLLNWTSGDRRSPMFEEMDRAESYCDMARTKWHGHVDGVIRMEMGFEIILCDFEKHLDFVEVLRSRNISETDGASPIWDEFWAWYTGTAARFDGIGTDRVTLDYDDFVTAHTYPVDLYHNGTDQPPRLNHLALHDLDRIRADVDAMVRRHHRHPPDHPSRPLPLSTNWQAVADMLVTRYSDAVPQFASLTDLPTLQDGIKLLMRPFIDFSLRDPPAELTRCTHHFLPFSHPQHSDSTSRQAITSVSHTICHSFLSLLSPSASPALAHSTLTNLTEYLDWTVWRTCPAKCRHDEVCFIPVWPVGTVEDRARGTGQCLNVTGFHARRGKSYWGMPPMPPPGDPEDADEASRDEGMG